MGNYCVTGTLCVRPGKVVEISREEPRMKNNMSSKENSDMLEASTRKLTFNNNFSTGITPQVETFEYILFQEINSIRQSPQDYAQKIHRMLDFIEEEGSVKYFHYPDTNKILLDKGDNIFYSTINLLKELKPIKQLIWNEELRVVFPKMGHVMPVENIGKMILKKREEKIKKFPKISFNYDIFANPIISVLFQITDEKFSQTRRNNILNPDYTYFAVAHRTDLKLNFFSISTFA